MKDVFEPLVERITALKRRLDRQPSFRWATVTAASPVEIQFDGEDSPIEGEPVTFALVGVGDRVLCLTVNRRVIILGTPL